MNNKLYIDISTKKGDLLSQLATKVSIEEPNVYLIVNSVPSFINTPVALAIFNKQISNYPKPIFWFSSNQVIVNFLRRCNARIKDPNLAIGTIQNVQLQKNSNQSAKQPTLTSRALNLISPKNGVGSAIATIANSDNSSQAITPTNTLAKTEQVSKLLEYRDKIKSYQDKIFKREEQKQFFREDYVNIQDFNSLIQKIEQTKSNLKASKTTPSTNKAVPSNIGYGKRPNSIAEGFNKIRLSLFTFLVFFGAMLLFVNTFFPTRVYTVELEPTVIQDKIQLVLTENSFNQDNQNLIIENSTPTTGAAGTTKDLASGNVKISNLGNQTINLTNGGFKLKSGGSVFTQVFDTKLPAIIKLDPGNRDVDIQVKAENGNQASELPSLSDFSLVNLNGDLICSSTNCKVFATTPISTESEIKKNLVTASDMKILEQTNTKSLNTKIASYLSSIRGRDNDRIIQNNWYKILDTKNSFDRKEGEINPTLTLKTEANVLFYDLSKPKLLDQLKAKIDTSIDVNDINIEGSELNFGPDQPTINLVVNYSGNKYSRLGDQEIAQVFGADTEIDTVSKHLREKYPGLGKIEVKQKGLSIPGLNPKINVDIVKK